MSQNLDVGYVAFQVMKLFIPFLFALCFHEWAHGFVARMRGDRTAELMGRLTLNPMAHADPIGTFMLPLIVMTMSVMGVPAMMFGWAKPVPVDERNLKNPKKDMFWIAAAGPLSNLFLALVGAVILGVVLRWSETTEMEPAKLKEIFNAITLFILMNVGLAVFNMLPFHPLDGGKVLARFLPDRINYKLEEMQMYFSWGLLILFATGAIAILNWPVRHITDGLLMISNTIGGAL